MATLVLPYVTAPNNGLMPIGPAPSGTRRSHARRSGLQVAVKRLPTKDAWLVRVQEIFRGWRRGGCMIGAG